MLGMSTQIGGNANLIGFPKLQTLLCEQSPNTLFFHMACMDSGEKARQDRQHRSGRIREKCLARGFGKKKTICELNVLLLFKGSDSSLHFKYMAIMLRKYTDSMTLFFFLAN